jgi:hypothetical protein
MLTVIQQEQGLLGMQRADHSVRGHAVGTKGSVNRLRKADQDLRWIGEGREIDPDDAMGEGLRQLLGNGKGKTGLAHAPGTGQRKKGNGHVKEQRPSRCALSLSSNQGGARSG